MPAHTMLARAASAVWTATATAAALAWRGPVGATTTDCPSTSLTRTLPGAYLHRVTISRGSTRAQSRSRVDPVCSSPVALPPFVARALSRAAVRVEPGGRVVADAVLGQQPRVLGAVAVAGV